MGWSCCQQQLILDCICICMDDHLHLHLHPTLEKPVPASASASASRKGVGGRPKGPDKHRVTAYLEVEAIADLNYIREYYGGLSISDGVDMSIRDIAKLLRRVGKNGRSFC